MPKANDIAVRLSAVPAKKKGEFDIFANVKNTNGSVLKSYKIGGPATAKKKPAPKKKGANKKK